MNHLQQSQFSLRILFVSVLVLSLFVSCKKQKGIDSGEWKDESLKMTAELCEKYRKCADPSWSAIPDKLKDFSKDRIEEANCQKRFRESNAYKLIGASPEIIVGLYRECHKQVLNLSCEDLRQGKLDSVVPCSEFKKIQSGN
ncbi:LA_2478/LA_2722/LA_4182 family protein [Leptospira idonii]|uniref:Uncharacterized protein n=1 Tax=Leptospira idonii TaxID=1193500 RepID=A0A4R9M102_9LEPT|nr:hypothetical protein [Leptospira idonii]TGN20414.1 hypothetical protein EHS15_04170 [Leptospira idonii]